LKPARCLGDPCHHGRMGSSHYASSLRG
jgi:hypothetical protein